MPLLNLDGLANVSFLPSFKKKKMTTRDKCERWSLNEFKDHYKSNFKMPYIDRIDRQIEFDHVENIRTKAVKKGNKTT